MPSGKKHTLLGRTVDGQQIYTVQNNLITPYQFTALPIGDQGETKWTERAPIDWGQYGPYYNLFLKYYLRRDGSLETIPNGGGNVHSVKCASFGSALGLSKGTIVTTNTIANQDVDIGNWSVSNIQYQVDIPVDKNYVKFGVFYKVNSSDPLRNLNFAGIYIKFSIDGIASYVNYATIHGGGVNLLGNSSNYTYINSYGLDPYNARKQWIGRPIIKFKKLAEINQSSVFDTWQYLEYIVPVPTFSTTPPETTDGADGKATSCMFHICFGENNYYLDDGSQINTGSVLFYYPFLNLI
jgi:hypothetical protein